MMMCPGCGKTISSSIQSENYKGKITEYYAYRCRRATTICPYTRSISERKLEKQLLNKLPELIQKEIAAIEKEEMERKTKPKYNIAGLKERLLNLNASYMAGNKTDEEYIAEGAELKALIAKAESEAPQQGRDLTPLKRFLDDDFKKVYDTLEKKEKRDLWRSIIKEIKLEDKQIVGVALKL